MRTIVIAAMLLATGVIPAAAGNGIQIGNTVTFKQGTETFSGRLTGSTLENRDVTVITLPKGKGVKVTLPTVKRIAALGKRVKVTPAWSYTERSCDLFRFELSAGGTVEGCVDNWPVFDVDTGSGGIKKNIWLEKLAFIEVGGTVATGNGLSIGSRVHYVKKGERFSGSLIGLNLNKGNDPVTIVTTGGNSLKLLLRDLRKIRATGEKKTITPPWSYTASSMPLFEFSNTDGKTIIGAVYQWPIFDVDTGTTGIQKNVWLEHLEYIETE